MTNWLMHVNSHTFASFHAKTTKSVLKELRAWRLGNKIKFSYSGLFGQQALKAFVIHVSHLIGVYPNLLK